MPTDAQSFPLPVPSLGYCISGKKKKFVIQAPSTISCVTARGSPLCQSHMVLSPVWLLHLGLNPSTSLPLQPHF